MSDKKDNVITLNKNGKPRKKHTHSRNSLVGEPKLTPTEVREWIPTDEERYAVKVMVAGGMKQEDIARCIHPSGRPVALSALLRKFRNELKEGKASITKQVVSICTQMALSGKHPAVTMFWLKAQAGWRDTSSSGSVGNSKHGTQLNNTEDIVKRLQTAARFAAETMPRRKTGTAE